MVNFGPLKEHAWHIYENYPYSMPTWIIILITVLGTFTSVIGLTIYCYCKNTLASNKPRIFSTVCQKKNAKNTKESKVMLSSLSQFILLYSRVKTTPEKLRERLKFMGMDFSELDIHISCLNRKDVRKYYYAI